MEWLKADDWLTAEGRQQGCQDLEENLLTGRSLVIAANRAPVTYTYDEEGQLQFKRASGGLVTALTGLAQQVEATWVGAASTDADREWLSGKIPFGDEDQALRVEFVTPEAEAYDQYYNVISNPLLWFLHHNMWDIATAPNIDRNTWNAWENGYVRVNRLFADKIAECIRRSDKPALVMMQDYQLYLAPIFLRERIRRRSRFTLMHFVHIPWPGPEDWGFLPSGMRRAILESLCSVDLLGFQTRDDALNFIRTCETHLPRAHVNFKRGRVWFRNHATHIRDFPISIDVDMVRSLVHDPETEEYYQQLKEIAEGTQLIVRIDRTDPSKNIVRGFQSFEEMLTLYPEHMGKVSFLALLAPSRLGVEEYQAHLDNMMAAAGRVNARFGTSQWEPVRVLVGESYPRAIAALRLYDVLLINSIADGMNLVAKEGPIVNERDGVLVLSELTGARQQLEPGALLISPCDIYATAQAIHQALIMSEGERQERATRLRFSIEHEDIHDWLCRQLEALAQLNL